jgi:hypothetical protein
MFCGTVVRILQWLEGASGDQSVFRSYDAPGDDGSEYPWSYDGTYACHANADARTDAWTDAGCAAVGTVLVVKSQAPVLGAWEYNVNAIDHSIFSHGKVHTTGIGSHVTDTQQLLYCAQLTRTLIHAGAAVQIVRRLPHCLRCSPGRAP